MIKFFPQLMHAFTTMHVAFMDGRVAQSTNELRAALAEALPLGRGDAFFALVSKITSTLPRLTLSVVVVVVVVLCFFVSVICVLVGIKVQARKEGCIAQEVCSPLPNR